MKLKVLMLGPGEGVMGGITTFVKTLTPVLVQYVDLQYLITVRHRPTKDSGKLSVRNITLAISQFARFLLAVIWNRPRIIHLHTSQGIAWLKDTFFILMGKALGCHIILHIHGGNFDAIYNKSHRSIQNYTQKVIGLADAVITVSSDLNNRLMHIVPVDRIFTLKNCIAIDAISTRASPYPINGAKALFLGIVGPSKGTFDLIEAIALLKTRGILLHLWIAGLEEREGDLDKARILTRKLDLEDMCQFVGAVYGASKSQLLHDASLFVLPSYHEALPMALLEAMAAGLPIVATRVGGMPEVVMEGYNGFLVEPGDVEALADKLAVLANDPHLCEVMGQRSRELAELELDVKPYVKRLVALYESIA
jgi:glycosyltransferase involved in cell wall biosynthesis